MPELRYSLTGRAYGQITGFRMKSDNQFAILSDIRAIPQARDGNSAT
jgi:hypothetical protein